MAACVPGYSIEHDHQLQIIVALDLQLHRDAIGKAIALRRPDWRVCQAHPEQLAELIPECRPDVVICTSLVDGIDAQVPMCVLLDTESSTGSIVSRHGARFASDRIGLNDLVDVIDRISF